MSIFKFGNYVDYLQALYQDLKTRKKVSAREFGQLMGYGSPSFIKELFASKRRIPVGRARTVGHRLGLAFKELDYFESLVGLSWAKQQTEINARKKHLDALRSVLEVKDFNDDWYIFFREWRAVALLQVFRTALADSPVKEIARILECDATQIHELLKLLERLKLIRSDGESYVAAVDAVSTPSVLPVLLRPYYKDLLDLARQKIDSLPVEKRLLMGLMFASSEEDLPKIRDEILEFLQNLNEKYSRHKNADKIYHLGIQCMPIY